MAHRAGSPLRDVVWRSVACIAVFMLLQAGWESARGSWIERLWVHELTVRSATGLINWLTPDVGALPQGTRIVAPGGGLNVLFGCEGTDVVFLLTAAFMAFALPWRSRLAGLAVGLVWVFVLNQWRIVALFYSFRADRELFDLAHTTAAPLLMIVLTGLFFHLWLRYSARSTPSDGGG